MPSHYSTAWSVHLDCSKQTTKVRRLRPRQRHSDTPTWHMALKAVAAKGEEERAFKFQTLQASSVSWIEQGNAGAGVGSATQTDRHGRDDEVRHKIGSQS